MKNFYDILQYLKRYDVYIHVGKRLWDIEVAALEVDNLYKAKVLSTADYQTMKIILAKEHKDELARSTNATGFGAKEGLKTTLSEQGVRG